MVRMGALLCLLSAAGFGAMAIFGKLAYDSGVEVGDLLLLRFALAAAVLLAIAATTGALRGVRAGRCSPGWRWERSATRRRRASTSARLSGWTHRSWR